MPFIYLSIIASILVVIGYIPEIYSIYRSKKADIENIYIWLIWSCASIFSISFCILNEEYYVMSTYIIIFIMNSTTLLLKLYYFYQNKQNNNKQNMILNKAENDNNIVVLNPLQQI